LVEEFGDGLVELVQAVEGPVSESCQNPALDDLDTNFCLRLIFRFSNAGGHDRDGIVLGPLVIGGIDFRVIVVGLTELSALFKLSGTMI
jgi:hypothetical protein